MSTFPAISAGTDISAGLLTSMLPMYAYKAADQSVVSSTTLVNDNALVLPLSVASAAYEFKCFLTYEGANNAGFMKWIWVPPSGTTMRYAAIFSNTSGVTTLAASTESTTLVGNTAGAGFLEEAIMKGTVLVSSTTGTLQLEWAQNASNATATIVHAQSYMKLTRIS